MNKQKNNFYVHIHERIQVEELQIHRQTTKQHTHAKKDICQPKEIGLEHVVSLVIGEEGNRFVDVI